MKLKKIFLSIVLSFLTLSSSFAMQPVGLSNGAGVCYANAGIQLLFAIPGFENYLERIGNDFSNKLIALYNSYKTGNPDNNIKMEIIQEVMQGNIAVQNHYDFMNKLFLKINPHNDFRGMTRELNIVFDINENHIANIVHTGGHYFAEIKYNEQWHKVDDANITIIASPTVANIQDQTKQVISISLSNGIDIDYIRNSDFELAQALSLSKSTNIGGTNTADEDINLAIALSLSSDTDRTNTDTEDSDIERAIALSLAKSETQTINQSDDDVKLERATLIIQNEEIYSIGDLSKLQGLVAEDDVLIILTTPNCLIEGTDILSELGRIVLTEIIAPKM